MVLFRIRCTGCGAPRESVKPTQKHLPRHLRGYPDPLVMTSEHERDPAELQWKLEKIRPKALAEQGERHPKKKTELLNSKVATCSKARHR